MRCVLALMLAAGLAGCPESVEGADPSLTVAETAASDAGGTSDTAATTGGEDIEAGDAPRAQDPGGGAEDLPVECSADQGAACSDGLECTVDECTMPGAVCAWTLKPETCLINNVCYAAGAGNPAEGCRVCDPAQDPYGWSVASDGATCGEDTPCAVNLKCLAGVCESKPVGCDDGSVCTLDACDPEQGCIATPVEDGAPCDDDDACTTEACAAGACAITPVLCDDGDACTDDACEADSGCTWEFNAAPCEDGDPCTSGDTCADGFCLGGPTDCDDGNTCTIDLCDKDVGCASLPTQSPCCTGEVSVCDDGNPCTTDLCDPDTLECSTELNTLPCDDGKECTVADACAEGACGGAPQSCDDGNACTTDECVEGQGCVSAALPDGPCDDGLACSVGDACVDGECVADTSDCACTIADGADAVKVTEMQVGTSGTPGAGLDVDGDPTTCAPSADCSGGVDNAFASLASLLNSALGDAVAGGDLMLLLELPGTKPADGVEFPIYVHQGKMTLDEDCDFQTETCSYSADAGGFADDCTPLFVLPATLNGDQLVAGGPDSLLPFVLPLQGAELEITLFGPQLHATVTMVGGQVTALSGVLGGAIKKTTLFEALDQVDPNTLPLDKSVIQGLLENLLQFDIDTDGDGQGDAASIGFTLAAIDALLVGVE